MQRRRFLWLFGAALALAGTSNAQSPHKLVRIGRLSPLSAAAETPILAALRQGLNELGWIEGCNFAFEHRFAEGDLDRLRDLADDLVRANVNVIVTGSSRGALAAKNATTTIPIVMVTIGDPVRGGLVASLARPGSNVTGVTALGQVLNVKRLELLKEALPGVKRVAVLTNPTSPYTDPFVGDSEAGARTLGLELNVVEVANVSELHNAFGALIAARADALMVLPDPVFITERHRILELVTQNRLPSTFGERESVRAGGLMFYGASLPDMYRRAATYVDRILKGAKPADLPVEQPTTFELAINLRTAKSLGFDVSASILARADELIE